MMKRVLLIGGGGTLGLYTAEELLRLGHRVDIISLDEQISKNENLKFYKADATVEYLSDLFSSTRYDGIVNFIHYRDWRDYIPYHALLTQNTEHLIFLSSYRVYADTSHPITEDCAQLIDAVTDDPELIERDDYGISKSRAERFLRDNPYPKNWTIVRPVTSFSDRRLDIVVTSGTEVVKAARAGKAVQLPLEAKDLTAGLDWAGNSGKLIANLLFKPECIGEAYTVSTAQNLTWGEVAELYTKILGVRFEWVKANFPNDLWIWHYDRAYDRRIDNTKILRATGLGAADFKTVEEGIAIELKKLGAI